MIKFSLNFHISQSALTIPLPFSYCVLSWSNNQKVDSAKISSCFCTCQYETYRQVICRFCCKRSTIGSTNRSTCENLPAQDTQFDRQPVNQSIDRSIGGGELEIGSTERWLINHQILPMLLPLCPQKPSLTTYGKGKFFTILLSYSLFFT